MRLFEKVKGCHAESSKRIFDVEIKFVMQEHDNCVHSLDIKFAIRMKFEVTPTTN